MRLSDLGPVNHLVAGSIPARAAISAFETKSAASFLKALISEQIEGSKSISFPVATGDNGDILPPIEHVARVREGCGQDNPITMAMDGRATLFATIDASPRPLPLEGVCSPPRHLPAIARRPWLRV